MLAQFRESFATVAAVVPRSYWYVWWGTLVNRLGGFIVPLLAIYLIEVRHLGVSDAGGIVSLFGAGSVLGSFAGGQMSDRLGRRVTLLTSLFGGAAALIALAFARDLTTIAILVGVFGLVGDLYRPAMLAYIADVVPPAQRVHAFSLLHWVINVGFAVASIVGGLLAMFDFTILFIADAATMVIFGVIVLLKVPETHRPPASVSPQRPKVRAPTWLADREFVVLVVISFAMLLLPFQSSATLSAHMSHQGFTTIAYGSVMAVNGFLIIAVQPAITAWAARRDPSRILMLAAVMYGAGISLHGLASTFVFHAFAVFVWTFGEILEGPSRSALVAGLSPVEARGRYQGAIVMTWGAAQFVAPKLGTWVWEHEGAGVLWASCLVLGIAVAAALAITAPALRRRLSDPSRTESS